jgi:hypothetical protein
MVLWYIQKIVMDLVKKLSEVILNAQTARKTRFLSGKHNVVQRNLILIIHTFI